ncbi:hypothetical protein BDZ91DRAFT_437014 [Kalaharituber pfeilii]|nr:hypothetical protein BDZ91DRAFT_437014 [Kalaharituber pfeilii]
MWLLFHLLFSFLFLFLFIFFFFRCMALIGRIVRPTCNSCFFDILLDIRSRQNMSSLVSLEGWK